jgi:DNA invertase Pin-like site-specific DNA recombinase
MSTERQNYSIQHQQVAIEDYARRRGISVVRAYEDHGKSGLRMEGRAGLRALLDDVASGSADFDTILVYDVSRWGRFQDADESAYYEFVCRRAGIDVVYCAEPFAEDDSPMAAILKALKRLMAGEYSRELSAKVFAAQSNFTLMGFKQGGPAGYGLRRIALDLSGNPRVELRAGERKAAQTDRVVLGLGSSEEALVVGAIYDWYLRLKLGDKRIASMLNAARVPGESGKPWTKNSVNSVLTNEKYAGHAVYNRTSWKLRKCFVKNPPDMWIRKDNAYPALVPSDLFEKAQAERTQRHKRYSDDELLNMLREIHATHGKISALLISKRAPAPTPQTFKYHFGTLAKAYALAGLDVPEAFSYVESRRALREIRAGLLAEASDLIAAAGGTATAAAGKDMLRVNDTITLKIAAVRCQEEGAGNRWRLRASLAAGADFVIAAKLAPNNRTVLDFYLVRMADYNGKWVPLPVRPDSSSPLNQHRHANMDDMFGAPQTRRPREV